MVATIGARTGGGKDTSCQFEFRWEDTRLFLPPAPPSDVCQQWSQATRRKTRYAVFMATRRQTMFKPPPHSLSSSRQPVSASGLVLKRRRFLSAHNFVSAPIAWTIGKYRDATLTVTKARWCDYGFYDRTT